MYMYIYIYIYVCMYVSMTTVFSFRVAYTRNDVYNISLPSFSPIPFFFDDTTCFQW